MNKKINYRLFIYVLSLLVVVSANSLFAQYVKVAKVGDSAPEFSSTDFKGKKFTFKKGKDNKVRLFWFTNLCSGCQSVILDMEKIKNMYEKKGVEIVLVSQLGTDKATVEKILKEKKLSLRFLYDPKGEVTSKYSGMYTPGTCPMKSLYLIDKHGTIRLATHFPGVPAHDLQNAIERTLASK